MFQKIITKENLLKMIPEDKLMSFVRNYVEPKLFSICIVNDGINPSCTPLEALKSNLNLTDKAEIEDKFSTSIGGKLVSKGNYPIDIILEKDGKRIGIDIKSVGMSGAGITNEFSVRQTFADVNGKSLDDIFEKIKDRNLDSSDIDDVNNHILDLFGYIYKEKYLRIKKEKKLDDIIHLVVILHENKTDVSFVGFSLFSKPEKYKSCDELGDLLTEHKNNGLYKGEELFFDKTKFTSRKSTSLCRTIPLKNMFLDQNGNISNAFGNILINKSKKRIEEKIILSAIEEFSIKIELNEEVLANPLLEKILFTNNVEINKTSYQKTKYKNIINFLDNLEESKKEMFHVSKNDFEV